MEAEVGDPVVVADERDDASRVLDFPDLDGLVSRPTGKVVAHRPLRAFFHGDVVRVHCLLLLFFVAIVGILFVVALLLQVLLHFLYSLLGRESHLEVRSGVVGV